jgi:hypothetical protein
MILLEMRCEREVFWDGFAILARDLAVRCWWKKCCRCLYNLKIIAFVLLQISFKWCNHPLRVVKRIALS